MKKIRSFLFLFLILTSIQCVQARENIRVTHKESGIYIFKINTKKLGEKIKPLAVEELTNTKDIYKSGRYQLVVNGGFFDMKSGEEISYVIIDGIEAQSPCNNEKLIRDLEKSGRTEAVLNRAEFRVLEKQNGKLDFQIAPHNAPPKKAGQKIKHSLQGGPQIAPKMDLVGESFVQYDENGNVAFESASVTKRRARTALALKRKNLYVIIFTSAKPATMNDLRDFCKKKRLRNAMALDGGGSTSLYYKNIEIYSEGVSKSSGDSPGRKVKSFLVIEK